MTSFRLGQAYDRAQINEILGGGSVQQMLITREKQIIACCYRTSDNLLAPGTLLLGDQKRALGEQWEDSGVSIPVFENRHKTGSNWIYIGDRSVRRSSKDPSVVAREKRRGDDDNVEIVLYTESASEATSRKALVVQWQHDVEKRQAVERAAVEAVYERYRDYEIESVELDNLGWDLEASRDRETLYLEVKGLSDSEVRVQLTPNEFKKMKQHHRQYRLCIVTNAVDRAQQLLSVFQFDETTETWKDETGRALTLEPITGARAFV